jgi:hypothetical protein
MDITTNPKPSLGTVVLFGQTDINEVVTALICTRGDNAGDDTCVNLKLLGFESYAQPGSDLRRDVSHHSVAGPAGAQYYWMYADEYEAALAAVAAAQVQASPVDTTAAVDQSAPEQ